MEIVQERLEREYDLDILATAPSVEYRVLLKNDETALIDSPALLPDENGIVEIQEPWMKIQVYAPQTYIGAIMDLVINKRGLTRRLSTWMRHGLFCISPSHCRK